MFSYSNGFVRNVQVGNELTGVIFTWDMFWWEMYCFR